MKKVIFLIVALIANIHAFSTVRTVSSNPATLGQFSTIQAAIDASADSDTVYVYGSPNVYATFTIQDKKITVIGPGWSPDKNLPLQAIVNGANIRNSPAGGSPDGSEIHGLVFTTIVDGSGVSQIEHEHVWEHKPMHIMLNPAFLPQHDSIFRSYRFRLGRYPDGFRGQDRALHAGCGRRYRYCRSGYSGDPRHYWPRPQQGHAGGISGTVTSATRPARGALPPAFS